MRARGTAEPGWPSIFGRSTIGSQLVPDEIRGAWEDAVAARRDWIEWWESFDYDGERWESPETRQRGFEIMKEATYLTEDNEFVDVDALGSVATNAG